MFVHKLTFPGLPDIRIESNSQGGVTATVEAAGGDGRFLTVNPGGGHWENSVLKSLPEGNAMELDGDGYPIVHRP